MKFERVVLAALLVVMLCLAAGAAHAARNPFITPKGDDAQQEQTQSPPKQGASFLSPLYETLSTWQMTLRSHMSAFARDIKEQPFGRSFWMFMLLAFAYGVLHALGPGHGKVFAVSFFMNRSGPLAMGFVFGNLCMFFHVLSSAVLVLVGKYILEASMSGAVEELGARLELISYSLLTGIGVILFVKIMVDLLRGGHGHHHHHPAPGDTSISLKSLMLMTLAAGLVPCPGAALILIFSITLGIQTTGLLALVVISLGMGLTLSMISILTIASRGLVLKALDRHERLYKSAHVAISLAGCLMISLVGGLLLAGRLGLG